jgi:hypothetical protein
MVLEASFHFIISRIIASFDPDSPERCLHLPPSLELGDSIVDSSTGRRFAQPGIGYYVRAEATIRSLRNDDTDLLETSLPIIITPHTEELPPTETKDFPSEFKEHESKNLKRTLLGTALGTLSISLSEPPPFNYDNDSVSGSTDAVLELEFLPSNCSKNTRNTLSALRFTVFSLVRAKTFYTVKSFPSLPGQDLLNTQKGTKLRNDIVKLKTRTVTNASWGYRFDLGGIGIDFSPNLSTPSIPSNRSSADEAARSSSGLKSNPANSNGKWISNWTIPIHVDGRLLPTFCSALVARSYSLIVRVKVSGVRQEVFDLEVPLQVVHTSPRATQLASESFLQPRRESETSWFSDESLVRQIFCSNSR